MSQLKTSATDAADPETKSARIQSLDQFRGYSVAAMFVVNFVQHMAVAHQTLKHNNTHFSYADSIMPSFILVCGMAYRMSFAKWIDSNSDSAAGSKLRRRILFRSLALILLCVMFFGLGGSFTKWDDMSAGKLTRFIAELLKANMWEVLAIIGACQLLVLPLMATTARFRIAAILALSVLHVTISWSFNYDFVYGKPNWMDAYFGAAGKRAWDGGVFGIIAWSQIMLVGTIAYDIMHGLKNRGLGSSGLSDQSSIRKSIGQLILASVFLMALGYSLSCLTRFYDTKGLNEAQIESLVQSPVVVNFETVRDRAISSLFAEPPFIPPPSTKERVANYWQMDKRIVSASFVFFSSGFALALYATFVLCCDVWKWSLGMFRTFGQNPLAAYLIHHLVAHTTLAVVPRDSSLLWVLTGLVFSFGITYWFVRYLEKHKLYLRL